MERPDKPQKSRSRGVNINSHPLTVTIIPVTPNPPSKPRAEKETAVALIERGWEVSKSAGDAAE